MESFVLKKLQELAQDSTSSDSSYSECQSSSEEEELLREHLEQVNTLQNNSQHYTSGVKIKSYMENIPACTDGDFKSLFRISRSSLEVKNNHKLKKVLVPFYHSKMAVVPRSTRAHYSWIPEESQQ